MSTGHADAIAERACKGIQVQLIVTNDVAEQLRQEPYVEKIEALKGYTNFRILVTNENVKFGLTVTDKCLSLGLYKNDGVTYDTTTDLFSFDQIAVNWGERLFEYYKNLTRPF
jgi:predicted transcriptional regulator